MAHQHKVALPRSYATRVAHSSNVVNVLVSFLCTVHKKLRGGNGLIVAKAVRTGAMGPTVARR